MINQMENDLALVLEHTSAVWKSLRNQKIFLTGGTGFFGTWLVESFAKANRDLQLNAKMTVLTRQPEKFRQKCPHLFADHAISFLTGDVRDFALFADDFAYVIHAATQASAELNDTNPLLMFDSIVQGTRHMLEFARLNQTQKILFVSSGAVYGAQPATVSHLKEDFAGHPRFDDAGAAYACGKLAAEHLCHLYAKQHDMNIKIARCFAFVGPHLPLDIHFAIGNFIRDGLRDGVIRVKGDGTPYRSYLYAADLAIWLWTILEDGVRLRPYNVGSDEAVSIAEVANVVANVLQPVGKIEIAKKADLSRLPEIYVPDTTRARTELNLQQHIGLEEAVKRTINWYRQ